MLHQHNSLFAASRLAAQKIMEDRKPLRFETTDNARIRHHLTSQCGLTDAQVTDALEGYNIINTARRMLSL